MNNTLQQLRIKHLRLLNMIHETGSLRRAAAELCLTQPAVTAMLKEVENAFGAQLVIRGSQGAQLTAVGQALRIRLGAILGELESAASDGSRQGRTMRLKVGAMKAAMFDIIPSTVSLLYQEHHRIDVRLMDGSIERMIHALLDNHVDCVVGRLDGLELEPGIRDLLYEEELLPTPLGVACAPGHPLAGKAAIQASDLTEYDWILLPATSQARLAFNLALIQQGLPAVTPVVESESLANNFHMVANSTLLTVAPCSAIARYRQMRVVEALPLPFALAISPISFICHRVKRELYALVQFRQALDRVVATLAA